MGSRSRGSGEHSARAEAVRADRRARRTRRRAEARRRAGQSYLDSIRVDDVVVFAAVTVVSVWAWVVFAIDAAPDSGGGAVAAAGAVGLGSVVLFSLRYAQRNRAPEKHPASVVRMPLVALPVVTNPLIFLAITQPDLAIGGFEPRIEPYALIALSALLMLGGVLAGLLAFALVVWPVLALVDSVRPPGTGGRGVSSAARVLTRRQLGGLGGAALALVGWATAMASVFPDAEGPEAQQRLQTIAAWVTLRGEPVPSLVALAAMALLVAAVWCATRPARATAR